MKFKELLILSSVNYAIFCATVAYAAPNPLIIEQQGSFAVGGIVKTSEGSYNPRPDITKGQTHNDFMDVYKVNITNGG